MHIVPGLNVGISTGMTIKLIKKDIVKLSSQAIVSRLKHAFSEKMSTYMMEFQHSMAHATYTV